MNEQYRARKRISAKKCRDNNIEVYRARARARYHSTNESVKRKEKYKNSLREEYFNNKDKHRNRYYQRKFGLTIEEYYTKLEAQNGVCAICGKESKDKLLAVDHCHDTGQIRDLLCQHCNTGIGHFREDEQILNKAIEYLRRWK